MKPAVPETFVFGHQGFVHGLCLGKRFTFKRHGGLIAAAQMLMAVGKPDAR